MFIFILYVNSFGQTNLVRNPSFEIYTICPMNDDLSYLAIGWNGIDSNWVFGGSSPHPICLPDYLNECSTTFAMRIPAGEFYYQYPRTGNGMMEVRMYDDGLYYGYVVRDYLQGRLYNTLNAGQSYCVTFYTVLGNYSAYAVSHIGAYLDNGMIDTTVHCDFAQTEYTPQILVDSIITDTLHWIKVQGSFVANGTEKFITIGEFFDTANIAKIKLLSGGGSGFYLVDDVSVIASNAQADAGVDKGITIGDSVYIGIDSNGAGMPCYWYIAGNPTSIDSGGQILVAPTTTTTYVVVMDLCGTITTDTVVVNVWALGESVVRGAGAGVLVYPNPATSLLTVAGAAGCDVGVYDMVGRRVFVGMAKDNKYVIDVGGVAKGVYFVEVVDGVTGERVVRRVQKI